MSAGGKPRSFSYFLIFIYGTISILITPSSSSIDNFVFGGCTQQKYISGSPYESNVNLLLSHLVKSAESTSYYNFTVVGSAAQYTVYGLYQCRGDLNYGDCSNCVARAVSQLGTICTDACGGALQLEGCFVKYDNRNFFGLEDKKLVVSRCGPPMGFDSYALTEALSYIGTGGGAYRVGGTGDVHVVAQCVGDLSLSYCQDCLSDAIGRLKSTCATSAWGDIYLAKCYARFTSGGGQSQGHGGDNNKNTNGKDNNGNDVNKTLAIIIGLIAAVALLIIFITYMNRGCEKKYGK